MEMNSTLLTRHQLSQAIEQLNDRLARLWGELLVLHCE